MGLFTRRGRSAPRGPEQPRDHNARPAGNDELVWLPGDIEVQVAGESFHEAAVIAAEDSVTKEGEQIRVLRAVLAPDPGNHHDPFAVAVYAAGRHVGFLPRAVARQVQPVLIAFAGAASSRRLVSCPAEIRYLEGEPQVVLLLDPTPLGLPPAAFEVVPEIAAAVAALLHSLDEPEPVMTGVSQQARSALALAEERRAEVDANYARGPNDWPQVEREFRALTTQLAQAGDPMTSEAWLGLGRATRYQKGRRDDTLAAFIKALQVRRASVDTWWELIDLMSVAPHVPTLLAIFARVPTEARPPVLAHLLQISHGRDRMGRLSPTGGERLRGGLLELAESQGDAATVATLTGVAGLAAEKMGDIGSAVRLWQRAVVAGSTDAKVADRFSIWLVKQHQHEDAAHVLRQALASAPESADLAERMRRRLARCERSIASGTAAAPGQPAYQGRHRGAVGN